MARFWIIQPGEQPEEVDPNATFDLDIRRPTPIGPIIGASLTEAGILLPTDFVEQLAAADETTGERQAIVLYVGPNAGQHEMDVASALGTTWNRTILVDEAAPGSRVLGQRTNRDEPA